MGGGSCDTRDWDPGRGSAVLVETWSIRPLGSTTADQRILFSDTAANSGQIVYNHTSNYMALSANGSERLRINSSGNCGIGTSFPSQKLTVQGTDARIYLAGANTDINMTGTADGQLSLDGNGFGFGAKYVKESKEIMESFRILLFV